MWGQTINRDVRRTTRPAPASASGHTPSAAPSQPTRSNIIQPEAPTVEVDPSRVEVLSASGRFKASDKQKDLCVLLADGRLLVAAGHGSNQFVQSYWAMLQRIDDARRVLKGPLSMVPVKVGVIAACYAAASQHQTSRSIVRSDTEAEAAELLRESVAQRASDIHISVGRDDARIKRRVHGDLEVISSELPAEHGMRLIRTFYQSLADVAEDTFKKNQRLDARIGDPRKLPEGLNGVRIATSPRDVGSLMVLRLLYDDSGASLDPVDLGFEPSQRELLYEMMAQPTGINIISGPTGAGKSTTLQRLLRYYIQITNGTKHVTTVEDPPEYPIEGANQTPVDPAHTPEERERVFVEAISNAMRLDPDVIMIGEVRDQASADLAFRAATTGHQVWTTLHANGALPSVDRLINMGLSADQIMDPTVLTGLASQRLVKRLCPHCRIPFTSVMKTLNPRFVERVIRTCPNYAAAYVTNVNGCDHPDCRHGTIGRTAIAEVLLNDEKFSNFIRNRERLAAQNYWLTDLGGMTFMMHAIKKIEAGLIDPLAAEQAVGRLHLSAPGHEH